MVRRSRRGYAMALMLLVLMVVTTVTVTVAGTAFTSQESSRSTAARSEARLIALSTLEELFARINTEEGFLDRVIEGSVPPVTYDSTLHPALNGWGSLDGAAPSGTSCPEGDEFIRDCYRLRVIPPPDWNRGDPAPQTVTLETTVRIRCAGSETRCVRVRFQQRLRRTQFFDFALAQELATLAPEALFPMGSFDAAGPNRDAYLEYRARCATRRGNARERVALGLPVEDAVTSHASGSFVSTGDGYTVRSCVDMAYQRDENLATGKKDDLTAAPIYTADDYITVCGNPDFSGVYVSGPGDETSGGGRSAYSVPEGVACADTDLTRFPSARTNVPMLLQPPAPRVVEDAEALIGSSIFSRTAPGVPARFSYRGAFLEISGVSPVRAGVCSSIGADVWRCPLAPSPTVVLRAAPALPGGSAYGSTDAFVSGDVNGQTSLVVDGSIAIDGDLRYVRGTSGSGAEDVLMLTATERIEIWQPCSPDRSTLRTDACIPGGTSDRTVHAILTSPSGFVGVPDWQSNTDPSGQRQQGTLTFFGSIASRYQGVFGSYTAPAGEPRRLVSGFYKRFTHDDLESRNISLEDLPFFVEPVVPVWNRVDVVEVPVRD